MHDRGCSRGERRSCSSPFQGPLSFLSFSLSICLRCSGLLSRIIASSEWRFCVSFFTVSDPPCPSVPPSELLNSSAALSLARRRDGGGDAQKIAQLASCVGMSRGKRPLPPSANRFMARYRLSSPRMTPHPPESFGDEDDFLAKFARIKLSLSI